MPEVNGGYSQLLLQKNKQVLLEYNPTARANIVDYFFGKVISQIDGNPPNDSKGEENEYWKAYLGIDNNVPRYNENNNQSWEKETNTDKHIEEDYYTTTPRMDLSILALADTMNLKRIVDNYDQLNSLYKFHYPKAEYEKLLNLAKKVMTSPNRWVQIDGNHAEVRTNNDSDLTNEYNSLGMLNNFGMMWNPDTQKLYVHDDYDFSPNVYRFSNIPERPVKMKIRSAVKYNPSKGAIILRTPDDYNSYPTSIVYKSGGELNYTKFYK